MPFTFTLLAILAAVVIFATVLLYLGSRYRRCPSDKILVIYGKVGQGQSAHCIHGGGKLILPLVQDYAYLSLTPMTIGIPLQNALSLQNIRINVPSTFTVGISTNPEIMNNAAERLLGLEQRSIEDMAREIIFGQLRLTVASLTIEQINQDRESFLESIRKNVEPELNKIGLYLINVNITDITDESDYIESIGKKAAAEAVNRARVDVAEQDKLGAIGQSSAEREKEIRVAENIASSQKGKKAAEADQRIYVQQQEAGAIKGEKEALADQRVFVQQQEASAVQGENNAKASIAAYNAELAVKEAEARRRGEVASYDADVEVQKAKARAEQERLTAIEIVRQEVDRKKIEIAAEAEAERTRREAKGRADAILAQYEAEAKGIAQVLQAKADGYNALMRSAGGDPKAAATLLMVEKIEAIVAKQVEAIQNIKIDKITVWDSGATGESSTANFVSNLVKSLPPLHEVAKMAGVDLPEYLGQVAKSPIPTAPTSKHD